MLYYNPKSIDEALKLLNSLKDADTVILAGGTDVVPKFNSRPERSGYFDKPLVSLDEKNIVYLGGADLDYVREEGGKIVIGAMATMTELLESPVIDKIPVLKEALSEMAGITVRNTATIGGNIMNASPAADSVPALIVLDAKAVLASVDGERTVDLWQLFEGPGKTAAKPNEILKEIVVEAEEGKRNFIKFGRRKAESLSVVNGAAYAKMNGSVCQKAIIALGAVAPTPLRMTEVEKIVEGAEITEDVIAKAAKVAAEAVKPIDDKRSSGDYRKRLVEVLVKRALTKVCC